MVPGDVASLDPPERLLRQVLVPDGHFVDPQLQQVESVLSYPV